MEPASSPRIGREHPARASQARALATFAGLAFAALAPRAAAQATTDEIGDVPVASLVTGLSFLSLSHEISGATLRVTNREPNVADTRIRIFKLPWEREVDVGSRSGSLYVEAVAAYLEAEDGVSVETPDGLGTVEEDWRAYSGLAGVGWTQHVADRWKVRASLSASLMRIENHADYGGPGAGVLETAIDGVLVDFDAWAATGIGSLTLVHERELGVVHALVRARHAWAESDVFESTSPKQAGTSSSRFLNVRADLSGPTGLAVLGHDVAWGAFASRTDFLEIDVSLGFDAVNEVGASLVDEVFGLRLGASYLFGPDVQGWSAGISFGG